MKVFQTINNVQKALNKVGIGKDSTNDFDHYKYRGIDGVYNTLAPILAECGLCILPRILSREVTERKSAKGGAVFYVTVDAEFDFIDAEDGSIHTVKAYGEAMDRSDKATNKAMTAAYKYMCFMAFCIPIEGDDADAETHQVEYATIDAAQQSYLDVLLSKHEVDVDLLHKAYKVKSNDQIPAALFDKIIAQIATKPLKGQAA